MENVSRKSLTVPLPLPTPRRRTLTHNDTKRVVAEAKKWVLVAYNKANYDKEGLDIIDAALQQRFPYSCIPLRNGKFTSWKKKLGYGGNNGRNHPVSAPPPPLARSSHRLPLLA